MMRTTMLGMAGMLLWLSGLWAQEVPATGMPGELHWRNGDVLKGELIGAGESRVQWQSDYFAQPVWLETPFLESVVFQPAKHSSSNGGPYRIELVGGDTLFGELQQLDGEFLTLEHKRYENVRLHRSEIARIQRLDHPDTLLLGPNGTSGWRTLESNWTVDQWAMRPGGGLRTERWRSELFRPLDLPERTDLEIVLSGSQRPEFALALSNDFEASPRLETWDDELVITQQGRFESVKTLSEGDTRLHLRLLADASTSRLSVYSGGGELLAAMDDLETTEIGEPGLYLRNKGPDLEIQKIRVAEWDGHEPVATRPEKNRVHLLNGDVVYGKVQRMEEGVLVLSDGRKIDLQDVDTIHFETAPRPAAEKPEAQINFPDGSRISGALSAVEGSEAKVRTNYAPGLLGTGLGEAQEIKFYVQADLPGTTPDELHMDGQVLKGTIKGGGEGSSAIRWLPLGSRQSVPIKGDKPARIVRKDARLTGNLDGDRLFLNSQEIISCEIARVDDTHVHFDTKLGVLNKIPISDVRAIEFREGRLQLIGFGDRAWMEIEGQGEKVTCTGKNLELDGGAFFHPSILRGDEVNFDLRWRTASHGAMSLELFAQEAPDAKAPLQISFSCWNNRLWVAGAIAGGGNMNFAGHDVSITNAQAKVRIRIGEDDVRVYVNGQQLHKIQFEEEKRLGNGLRFSSGNPWFDRVGDFGTTLVSNFEVRSTTGLLAPLRVDAEAKTHALTVPRFRRDNPDTHILIAPTGDLLRGRLNGVDENGIHFSSRMDSFTFPRDRVSGIVCLDVDTATVEPLKNEARVILTDGTVIRLQPAEMTETTLLGESPSLGPSQIPTAAIRQIHLGKVEAIPGALVYGDWNRVKAAEPVIPDAGKDGEESEWVGKQAPQFLLTDLKGETFILDSQKGKVVVLEFWATWCGPCAKAFPDYIEALEDFDPEQVRFVTVNQAEPPNIVERYLERHQWDFEVVLDSQSKVGRQYGVEGIPHTVVVDQNGDIAWVQTGFQAGAGEALKQKIEGLLNSPPTTSLGKETE